jgi:4-amino-4-deoxy-L-arabinose transferase-like glycosyltransferase
MRQFMSQHRYPFALAVILLLAAFMRLYQLQSLPPGLHADEAANGLDIINILENHDIRPFYDANGGREGLFFFLQAIGVKLLGTTVLGLRIVPALLGVIAVGIIYLWLTSWFSRRVALLASLLVAASPWAITISRNGYRAGMMILMVPLVLWLYTKALKTGRLQWYLAAGASLGLGFYTYPAFWMVPLVLVVIAAHLMVRNRPFLQQSASGVAKSLAVTAVVLAPLAWYGIQHPGQLFGRPAGVSVLSSSEGVMGALSALGSSIIKTLLMFNVHGDENYRHNLGGQPELNIFVGAMFILGILICAARIKQLRYGALLAILIGMLLPSMITTESIPHALRAYGALPAAAALSALGIIHMLDRWRAIFPLNGGARMLGGAAITFLLLLTVYHGYTQYFVAWANAPQTYAAYQEDTARLAEYYNTTPFNGQRYALGEAYELQPVAFLTHKKASYKHLEVSDIDTLPLEPSKAKEFSVLTPRNSSALKRLQHKYPKLKRSPHYSHFDDREIFTIYTVPSQ